MTYKRLADLLGVKKDKVRYLAEQLPAGAVQKIDGVMHMSNHAVDAVISAINGGELESAVEIPPYNSGDPVGWDWNDLPANFHDSAHVFSREQTANTEFRTEFHTADSTMNREAAGTSADSSCNSDAETAKFAHNFADSCEIPYEHTANRETPHETEDSADSREIAEYYQRAFLTFTDQYNQQIKSKDEQIKQLTEQLGILASAIADRDKSHDSDTAEQLSAKDSQIQRMQDTIDALTRQLEAARQGGEQPRKWWQWWKR